MNHDGGWSRKSSRYLFQSQWFNLRQDEVVLPAGEQITYTMVEHPGYVMVVPLLDDGRVLLERVYRYTIQQTVLECPSGGIEQEAPESAAHRELREETGWAAGRLSTLGSFFGSNGISNEQFQLYLATELREDGPPVREATEDIELAFMTLTEAVQLALSGEIVDAPSALALILADHQLRNLDKGHK